MESITGALPLFLLLAVLFWWLKRRTINAGNSSADHDLPFDAIPPESAHHWVPSEEFAGSFEVEVVGESSYRKFIKAAARHTGPDHAMVDRVALLLPEDSNPHDKKAIAIVMDRKPVGYLSREDARAFRKRLSAKKLTGAITSANARITHGGIVKGKNFDYSVRLDMTPFYED